MFIRYKCTTTCFFYDEDENSISPIAEDKTRAFIISEKDIKYFRFKDSDTRYELNNYKLNINYYFQNGKIRFILSAILKKEQEINYYYEDKSLFEYFEVPNIYPNNNDSIFRENFKDSNKQIYLSKYNSYYYPMLSVSPPNFIFDDGKYKYTDGEATKLYEAFRYKSNIPKTLFLKPYCRQWNTGKVLLNEPNVYQCSYDYANQTLTVGDKVYENVPHMITICCQGAGSGGEKGVAAGISGHAGLAGGFIAANYFLGNDANFKISVGKGGGPVKNFEYYSSIGESSIVEINQIIDFTSFENEKNPTFVSHNGFKYTKLENKFSLIAEGGRTYNQETDSNNPNNSKPITHIPGNGKIEATTIGYDQNGNKIETNENSNYILSSLFFKILFNAKGGKGGEGIYGDPSDKEWKNAQGTEAYFTEIEDSTYWPNIKTAWLSDNTYQLVEEGHIYTKNNLDSPLILGGSSLKESLYTDRYYPYYLQIKPSLYPGGSAGSCYNTFYPGGGGGGSSLFGYGGMGGSYGSNNGKDGQLGAGGGGGQGGVDPGNGGNGGNGAVWLLW